MWLAGKLKEEEDNLLESGWASCRYGLYEDEKGGWRMEAPELSMSGMVQTRSEWEEDCAPQDDDLMEVDQDDEGSGLVSKRWHIEF